MKKRFLSAIVIAFFTITVLQAQPVMQSFNGGVNGNTIIFKDCDSSFVAAGASGANVTWDFSGLNVTATRYEQVVDPGFAPHSSEFPEANYCRYVYPFPESYTFYSNTADALYYWGFSLNSIFIRYNDPVKMLQFPFTYSDSFMDTTLNITGISQEISYRENMADGYGTLILPNASYDNVLRIKTTDISIDSNFSTGNINISYLNEYNFYHPDIIGPLLILSERKTDSSTLFKVVLYNYDPLISIQKLNKSSIDAGIYPNPVSEFLNIELPETNQVFSEISIINATGKKVLTVEHKNEALIHLNVSDLKNGMYFIRFVCERNIFLKMIVVLH